MPRQINDPYASFRFKVRITGLDAVATFQSCSAITVTINTQPVTSGGQNSTTSTLPKPAQWEPITLKRGIATDSAALWRWVQKSIELKPEPHDVTISLLNSKGTEIASWTFHDTYPTKWTVNPFDANTTSGVAIEELQLTHQGVTFENKFK